MTDILYPVGTVLTRHSPEGDKWDSVQVVGAGKEALIVSSTLEFSQNVPLPNSKARADYTTDTPENGPATTLEGQIGQVAPRGPSPEEVFNAQDRAAGNVRSDGLTRVQRAERDAGLRQDAVAVEARQRVDTGIPTVTNLSLATGQAAPVHQTEQESPADVEAKTPEPEAVVVKPDPELEAAFEDSVPETVKVPAE